MSLLTVTFMTGSGKGGKVGDLVCGGGTFKGEVLAGQPNGSGQFYTSQVLGDMQIILHIQTSSCMSEHEKHVNALSTS